MNEFDAQGEYNREQTEISLVLGRRLRLEYKKFYNFITPTHINSVFLLLYFYRALLFIMHENLDN